MIELGQLEAKFAAFDKRKVRLVVISDDEPADAQWTQEKFPHLTVVSDPQQNIARALEVIHEGAKPGGGDTSAPTTFLVDSGYVRWYFRPTSFMVRLSSKELLSAIDETWK